MSKLRILAPPNQPGRSYLKDLKISHLVTTGNGRDQDFQQLDLHLKREASIIVHWSETETTRLALGQIPIVLESSRSAHIPLPRTYPAITAKIYLTNQELIMEFGDAMKKQSFMKILSHKLNDGENDERYMFGNIQVEIQIDRSGA